MPAYSDDEIARMSPLERIAAQTQLLEETARARGWQDLLGPDAQPGWDVACGKRRRDVRCHICRVPFTTGEHVRQMMSIPPLRVHYACLSQYRQTGSPHFARWPGRWPEKG